MKYRLLTITAVSVYVLAGPLLTQPALADDGQTSEATTEQDRSGGNDGHRKHHQRWKNMSDEEREAAKAKRKKMREKLANMTPEQRKTFRENRMQEKLAKMTPEQRERFQEHRAKKIKRFDADGDGELNDTERQAMKEEHKAKRQEHKAKRLQRFDTDGDGQISDAERQAVKEAREERRLQRLDTDGDVLLPDLSRRLKAEDTFGSRYALSRATEFALFLTVPAGDCADGDPGAADLGPLRTRRFRRGRHSTDGIGARRLRRWPARLRAAEGAATALFRAGRHRDAVPLRALVDGGERRTCHRPCPLPRLHRRRPRHHACGLGDDLPALVGHTWHGRGRPRR